MRKLLIAREGDYSESHQVHQNVSNTYGTPPAKNVVSGVQLESNPCFALGHSWAPCEILRLPTNGLHLQCDPTHGHCGHRVSLLLFAGDDNISFPIQEGAHRRAVAGRCGLIRSRFHPHCAGPWSPCRSLMGGTLSFQASASGGGRRQNPSGHSTDRSYPSS
jgi:hypothetical protein